MTVKEMKEAIKDHCKSINGYCSACRLNGVTHNCYALASDTEIRQNYKIIFGTDTPVEPAPVVEAVAHPSHYNFSKYEPVNVIREWQLNFNLGNVIKYVARAGRKDNIIQDLKKARQYLDFEIQALEKEQTANAKVI